MEETNETTERERFETWFKETINADHETFLEQEDGGAYVLNSVQRMWFAWNAGRYYKSTETPITDAILMALNMAFELDANAVRQLVDYHVPTNEAMRDHESAVCGGSIKHPELTLFGVMQIAAFKEGQVLVKIVEGAGDKCYITKFDKLPTEKVFRAW